MVFYKLVIARSAQKDIKKLPRPTRTRVIKNIHQLRLQPRPQSSEKLKGLKASYRLRLGDYRIIYRIQNGTLVIIIVDVGHHRDIYKNL